MNQNNENPLTPPLALGGALLMLISLFINWFSLDADAQGQDVSLGFARPDTAVLLFVIVIAVAVTVGFGRMRDLLRGHSTLLTAAGLAAFLYTLVTLIKKPQLLDLASSAFDEAKEQAGGQLGGADFGVGTDIGLYVALLGTLLVLGAGLMEMLGKGNGSGNTAGRTGGGLGAGPPSPPPPAAGGATQIGGAPAAAAGGAPPPADRSPGWQPDPHGQARLRYWDGNAWTEHTNG